MNFWKFMIFPNKVWALRTILLRFWTIWLEFWCSLDLQFDHISQALIDLHWLPYRQPITYKLRMTMFKYLGVWPPHILLTFVLVYFFSAWSLVSKCVSNAAFAHAPACSKTRARMQKWANRRRLRSAAHCDIFVPNLHGVWYLLLWLILAVGMFCRLIRGLPLLGWILLQNTWNTFV